MDYAELTAATLDVEKILAKVGSPDCGAISLFLGTTRDHFEGRRVAKLSYEAYAPMAKREMLRICDALRRQWNVKNVALVHRLGEVPVGEASVLIAISSEHRQEAQAAVKYAMDEVKGRVPVWKKEIYEDGDAEWKENKECFWTASS